MKSENQPPQPAETGPTGNIAASALIKGADSDQILPEASAFVATLPVVAIAGLAAAYWPSLTHAIQGVLIVFGGAAPVVSGILAAYIHLRNQPARRTNLWKCSVWIWTWMLLFLVLGSVVLHADLGFFVIVAFPYTFPLHGLFILLALVGLGLAEFTIGLHCGWKRWWTPAEWRRNLIIVLLVLLMQLSTKMCASHP